MKINIDIEEVILTLEEDIEKLDRNPPMNVIIVADLDIGLMNVICLKLSKLYKYIYLLIYFFLNLENLIPEEKMIEAIVPIPMIINQKSKNIQIKRKKQTSPHQISS